MGEIRCLSCNSPVDSSVDGGSSLTVVEESSIFLGTEIGKEKILSPVSRQRFVEQGRKSERERIIKILKEDRKCQHGTDCLTMVNIGDIIKNDYSIDIEKLIRGE